MIAALFAPLGARIFAALSIGLAVTLAFVMWRADNLSDKLEKARGDLTAEMHAHAITRDSVELLQTKIADQNARIDALAAAGDAARKRASEALKEARTAQTGAARASARIEAQPSTDCETSEAIRSAGL